MTTKAVLRSCGLAPRPRPNTATGTLVGSMHARRLSFVTGITEVLVQTTQPSAGLSLVDCDRTVSEHAPFWKSPFLMRIVTGSTYNPTLVFQRQSGQFPVGRLTLPEQRTPRPKDGFEGQHHGLHRFLNVMADMTRLEVIQVIRMARHTQGHSVGPKQGLARSYGRAVEIERRQVTETASILVRLSRAVEHDVDVEPTSARLEDGDMAFTTEGHWFPSGHRPQK